MNNLNSKVLVTIITESVLESEIAKQIKLSKATGYTVFDVRGKGEGNDRQGDWKENSNIQFEVICSEATAETLITTLEQAYFENYQMVVYQSQVKVLRSEKF